MTEISTGPGGLPDEARARVGPVSPHPRLGADLLPRPTDAEYEGLRTTVKEWEHPVRSRRSSSAKMLVVLVRQAAPTGRRPRLASVGLQDGSKMGPTKSDGSALSGQTTGGRPSVVELVRQRLIEDEVWDWLGLGGIEGRSHRFGASPRDVPAETFPAPLY